MTVIPQLSPRGARSACMLGLVGFVGLLGAGCQDAGKDGGAGEDGMAGRSGEDGAPGEDGEPASAIDSDGDGISIADDCDDLDPALGRPELRYLDYDGDGYGTATVTQEVCGSLPGWVEDDTDCDDLLAQVNPSATEVCNDGMDDDCDGLVDDADDSLDSATGTAFYTDGDEDGYGDAEVLACALRDGLTDISGDCDDTDATVNPGAEEICADGIDQNCNGGPDQCAFPDELSTEDAEVSLRGESVYDYLGESMSVADINGDGIDDLFVGATHTDDNGSNSGSVYGLMGSSSVAGMALEDAVAIRGVGASAVTGFSVAGLGDLDGDGYEDLGVGAHGVDSVYVVHGGVSAWSAGDIDRYGATITPVNDVWFFGREVQAAGDVDGDGLADMLIGDEGSSGYAGTVYLVLGSTTAMSGSSYIEDIRHAEWTAESAGDDFAERGTTGAGDFDGDGLSDIVLGEPSNDDVGSGYGEATVYLGSSAASGDVELADADVTLAPVDASDAQYLGYCAGGIGDHDGDGVEDLAVCARFADVGTSSRGGAVYLYLGDTGGWSSALGVGDADVSYLGTGASQFLGSAVEGTGDIDGDGTDDFMSSASDFDGEDSNTGGVFLFYGDTGVGGGVYDLNDAVVTITSTVYGARLGTSLAAGDINGDGYVDLMAGSSATGNFRGAAFMWLGTGF